MQELCGAKGPTRSSKLLYCATGHLEEQGRVSSEMSITVLATELLQQRQEDGQIWTVACLLRRHGGRTDQHV